jgi:propionyl-CoA carboxylase alpha chain
VDTGVYEGGEISMYYDSMIAKLITHGATRREAIDRMRAALDAFVIRGISSNVPFQAALLQHPRFVSGDFNTGFIAEEFPKGFGANTSSIGDPSLMVVAGAMIFHRYKNRNATISGQMAGHEYEPENHVVVMIGRDHHPAVLNPASGGYDVTYRDQVYEVRSEWTFGQSLFRGTIDGQPVCMQLDRHGLKYRLTYAGRQVEIMALSRRAAELQALMPVKVAADLSKFLLAPMPGLLTEIAVTREQEVKAGDKLAVIEAMKMENVLRAERDGIVSEVLAKAGESLAVDQAIVKFQ